MNLRLSICLGILLFAGFACYAQTSNLYFHHFDKNSGIPQSVCNNIFKDSRGFIWITTTSGLYRFDGSRFTDVFKSNELLKSHALKDIREDKTGTFWLTKNDDELVRFDPYSNAVEIISLRVFLQPYNVKVKGLNIIHIDEYGRLWIGINGSGIACFNIKSRDMKIVLLPDNIVSAVFFDKGNLFNSVIFKKSSASDSVYRGKFSKELDIKWEVKVNPAVHFSPFTVSTDQHNAWYIDSNFLVQYNWTTNTQSRYYCTDNSKTENLAPEIMPDAKRRLWVRFRTGVTSFDIDQRKFTRRLLNDPYDQYSIKYDCHPVLCDEEENLWLSSFGDGISFCNLSSFRLQHLLNKGKADENGITNFIRALTTDHFGNIYLSAEGKGIVLLDSNADFKRVLFRESAGSFEAFLRDRDGKIWFGGSEVVVYNPDKKKEALRLDPSLLGWHRVASLLQLHNGKILIGTYANLFIYDPAKKSSMVLPGIQEKDQIFSFLFEIPGNDLLVGHRDKGLKRYRPAANGYTLQQDIHPYLFVKSSIQINADELWLATTLGLYSYKISSGLLKPLTEINNKLPDLYLYALLQDAKGFYWVSSNNGLFRWKDNEYQSLGSTEGVQSREFNTNAFCRADDGALYFGGVNGLNKIGANAPGRIYEYSTRLQLLRILAGDTVFLHPNEQGGYHPIKVPPGNSTVEIEYTIINFFKPEKYKVQYRLKNYNESWQTADGAGTARFVNIQPGQYVFEIRFFNPDNLQTGRTDKLPVYITPFWWQTTAFKIMAVLCLLLAVAGVIIFIFRNRLRRERIELEKKIAIQQERERIVSDLHDDIGATLSSMNIYGELASEVMSEKPEEAQSLVNKISGISKELMGRMGDIIWSMKPGDEEKYTLEARLKNYCSELLSPKNIHFDLDIDPRVAASVKQPEFRKNILLIAREAVNNIAKYSGARKVDISFKEVDGVRQLLIRDDGQGFDPAAVQGGNGLTNIRQRCRQLGGECTIQSSPGNGVQIGCRFA